MATTAAPPRSALRPRPRSRSTTRLFAVSSRWGWPRSWLVALERAAAGRGVAAPEALCPFGGIETAFRLVTGAGYVPHVHASNVVLGIAVLILALLARSAFCGWLCPLGFLQDLVSGASRLVQRKVRPVRLGVRWLKAHARPRRPGSPPAPAQVRRPGLGRRRRSPLGRDGLPRRRSVVRPPRAFRLTVIPAALVLAVILVAALFVDRPWCRYACPNTAPRCARSGPARASPRGRLRRRGGTRSDTRAGPRRAPRRGCREHQGRRDDG